MTGEQIQHERATDVIDVASWGWTGELTPEEVTAVAPISLQLALCGPKWINRRVHTITLLDESTLRQHISVDFRLPERLPSALSAGGEAVDFVPLIFLPRRDGLSFFDVRDEVGAAVPLLSRRENAQITGLMLVAAAQQALRQSERHADADLELAQPLKSYLIGIATRPFGLSREFLKAVTDPSDPELYPDVRVSDVLLREDQDFRALLSVCSACSAVHVPLMGQTPGRRRVIKISWEDRWRTRRRHAGERRSIVEAGLEYVGWRPYPVWLDFPAGGVESDHYQVAVPPGVELTEAAIVTVDAARAVVPLAGRDGDEDVGAVPRLHVDDFAAGYESRAHLYVPRAHDQRIAALWVRLRPRRQGFLTGAVLTSFLVTGILAVFWRNAHDIVNISEAAAAVLLLVPALIAGFLVRPSEHAMAERLLTVPRLVMSAVAAIPLIAAALLVAVSHTDAEPPPILRLFVAQGPTPVDPKLTLGWELLAIAAAVATTLLAASWYWPRPGTETTLSPPAPPDVDRLQMDASGAPPRSAEKPQ